MTRDEIIQRLKEFLKYAPQKTAPSQVKGWDVDGVLVCANCAGRIMDRGCNLGHGALPIWDGPVDCDICPTASVTSGDRYDEEI